MNTKHIILITAFLLLYTLHLTLYTNIVYAASKGKGPVGYWRFDECGHDTAYDDGWTDTDSDGIKDSGESWNNNDGTLDPNTGGSNTSAGQMWTRQGKFGGAIDFDGTDDRISATVTGITTTAGESNTVEFWMYWAGTYNEFPMEFSSYRLWITSTNTSLGFNDGAGDCYGIDVSGYANKWVYVTAVFYNGVYTDNSKLYINGVLQILTQRVGSAQDATATTSVTIGGYAGGATSYPFTGKIDDFKIYNYARTAEQIMVDYQAGAAVYSGAGTDPNEGNPPVGYWSMDENTGTNARDRSGGGNDGSFGGAPTWSAGKYGSCLSFDGNDYVEVADPSDGSLDFGDTDSFTIVAWAKATSSNTGGNRIVDKYGGGGSAGYYLAYDGTSGQEGKAVLVLYPTLTESRSNIALNDDTWHHIAAVKDESAGRVYLYVDGVLHGDVADNTTGSHANSEPFRMGSYDGSVACLTGLIEDVKLYNYARTQAQIAYDYNKGRPVAHYTFDEDGGSIAHNAECKAGEGATPVAWWRMDEGTGGTTSDYSGNGNTGTLYPVGGGTNLTTADMWDQTGKIGPDCLEFDGTDDYVSMGDVLDFGTTDGFTIAAWVKTTDTDGYIVQKVNSAATIYYYFGVFSSKLRLRLKDTNANNPVINSTNNVNDGNWHHIVCIRDAGNKLYLYIDGVSAATSISDTTNSTLANDGAFEIGQRSNGGANKFPLNGLIDDVRIYNYARTAEQIYSDYKNTHGTMVGNTKFVDGKLGKALSFDGTGDYVQVADNSILDITDAITISAWIKPNAVTGSFQRIFHKNTAYTFNIADTGSKLGFYNYGTSYWSYSTANVLAAGTWMHVVITKDTSGVVFYVDGVQQGSDTAANAQAALGTSDVDVFIAIDEDATSSPYTGLIDDVRTFNYVRTADQIMQDYNAGASMRTGDQVGVADPWGGVLPVAHWTLDENTGVLAFDASQNSNDGTLGGDGAGTDVPTWTQGKVGQCLKFDGTDDYVGVSADSSIDAYGKTALSIQVWVYTLSGGENNYGRIIDKTDSTAAASGVGYGFYVWNPLSSTVQLEATMKHTTTNAWVRTSTTVTLNTWHHVAYVYNALGTKRIQIYIDGNLATLSTDQAGSGDVSDDSLINPRIGNYAGDTTRTFDGLIDDVKIYNYARTQAQIAWDFNRGAPVGHWRFDEATSGAVDTSSGAIKDDSVHDNDGTASNTTWSYTTGRFGGALDFGGNDYVEADSVCGDVDAQDFTVTAWVKSSSSTTQQFIVAFNDSAGGNRLLLGHPVTNSDLQLVDTAWHDTDVQVVDGTWHFVAYTLDASGDSIVMYVDGKNVLEFSSTVEVASTDQFNIGMEYDTATPGDFWIGQIDDVRVYNYARTAEQIMQDYNAGAAAKLSD